MAAALAAAALVAAPAAWLARADTAAKPATQREGARADGAKAGAQTQTRPDADPDGRPDMSDRPRGPRFAEQRPLTPGEWDDIAAFMSEHMPWRIAQVQQMPDGPVKERIKRLLAVRYRGLRVMENRDPEGYEQRLGQLKIEDQVYKLVSEVAGTDPEGREKIREQLRDLVSRLVDIDLQERRRRVVRLEEELNRQKRLLEQDTRDRDVVIERRAARFLDWGNRWPGQRGAGPGRGDATDGSANPPQGEKRSGKGPAGRASRDTAAVDAGGEVKK